MSRPQCHNKKSAASIYRPRHPRSSPLYRLLEEHFERFCVMYEERFERDYGPLRPVVGRAVRKYLECGILENGFARVVLRIIVGDHGEDLGDHGEMSHGTFLYDSTVRVPLIISFPEMLPEGVIHNEVVSVVDILPTVLEILGIDAAPLKLHGESLLPAVAGGGNAGRPVYAETRLPLEEMGWSPLESVVLGEWKYIRAPREELYNVYVDPGEESNLLEKEPAVASHMRTLLDSLEQEYSTARGSARFQADRETLEKLAMLGYISQPVPAGDELSDPKDMLAVLSKQEKGLRFFEAGEYEEAEEAFAEALEMDLKYLTF